ncbi:hypothetical protein [Paracoccus sp. AS002]|uniref:hypothetical protein n=1 Tax=Paracoccus sp. AS002 TaxID=3019545 RepID=UPI0023E835A5|nr:hypothetical protein [Paracoccus sp. AS002]MDF3906306.1 hypothetical protein [Paracoccus sp. AS002]
MMIGTGLGAGAAGMGHDTGNSAEGGFGADDDGAQHDRPIRSYRPSSGTHGQGVVVYHVRLQPAFAQHDVQCLLRGHHAPDGDALPSHHQAVIDNDLKPGLPAEFQHRTGQRLRRDVYALRFPCLSGTCREPCQRGQSGQPSLYSLHPVFPIDPVTEKRQFRRPG